MKYTIYIYIYHLLVYFFWADSGVAFFAFAISAANPEEEDIAGEAGGVEGEEEEEEAAAPGAGCSTSSSDIKS